ncbi:GTP-binding protein [Shewanella sp. NIFS-20-20]|uniref:CobW family GTP-binding protein n=1 Tax=Shewanella sp. NIFS-20-20 TaxID=2853806 RepID=UPI001C47AA56|nr:GTP-binding protein [Shewanella sp. NIFS-20-20]MBV7314700.1 GTP-binding protein [Shewanella sp. NIFS-20-20]
MIVTAVAVNLITGLLGAGKTSLIKELLAHKPPHERWAVLVNEFGQVGLDAALLPQVNQVQIKQVAGGCMCCASGVPTHIAINQILQQARPHRLLIEPSGLGHPRQILKLLQSEHFAQVLKLQTSLCVIDARKLKDERYRQLPNLQEQLHLSDIIIASKADCYADNELATLTSFTRKLGIQSPIVAHGRQQSIAAQLIPKLNQASGQSTAAEQAPRPLSVMALAQQTLGRDDNQAPAIAYDHLGICHHQQHLAGHYSAGWVFDLRWQFDLRRLLTVINSIHGIRLKAVFITPDGIAAFNRVDDDLTITELDDALDSRIEVISQQAIDIASIKQALQECRSPN